MINLSDTICAPATAPGGAIAIIRISGSDALVMVDAIFQSASKTASPITEALGYTIHYGSVYDSDTYIDDVLVSVFRAPHSYTGEDSAEISCHGSQYIVRRILELLVAAGCRMAEPGEFTRRAFLAGKMDLSQAEAVADVISSSSEASLRVAQNQLRGGVSTKLSQLRDKLLEITSLLELELDFSEEEVEFADRQKLTALTEEALEHISRLAESFSLGNAIKNGVPVAIVGATNTGKSTLLNALIGDDRAIVSEIDGTTRDTVEETFTLDGILFRFIDTAGIRKTDDQVEKIGIERSLKAISQSQVVIALVDCTLVPDKFVKAAKEIVERVDLSKQKLLLFRSKVDLFDLIPPEEFPLVDRAYGIFEQKYSAFGTWCKDAEELSAEVGHPLSDLSAVSGVGMEELRAALIAAVSSGSVSGRDAANDLLITNSRHYEALVNARSALLRVSRGLSAKIPSDLVAEDLRETLRSLGTITGEITTPEVLANIFSKFCIGK